MAERVKHHFVPKMLLKRFSYNKTHIGVYRKDEGWLNKVVPYGTQCQERYLYGYDGFIERALGGIESELNNIFDSLIGNCLIPLLNLNVDILANNEGKKVLLIYLYIQYSRVSKTKRLLKEKINNKFREYKDENKSSIFKILDKERERLNLNCSDEEVNDLINDCNISMSNIYHHVFRVAYEQYKLNSHLKGVLFLNLTSIPFVIGDSPAIHILSNFVDEGKHVTSFFMPVSPAHYLFFLMKIISMCQMLIAFLM